jgi:hypothetical protein
MVIVVVVVVASNGPEMPPAHCQGPAILIQ